MRTVLLLSDKSSGSTALQYELLRHADVRAVGYTMHNDHETLFWVKAAVLLGQEPVDFVEGRLPIRPAEARRDLLALLRENVPHWTPPSDDESLVFEGWRMLCEAHAPVFFEKSPHHLNSWAATSLLLRYALTTDHDVRIIGLVRNPLAVLYSAWTRWLTPPRQRQAYWLRTYRNLLAVETLLGPERVRVVRYEDIIARPVAELREITDWLGLEASDEVGSGLHDRSAQKWVDDPSFDLDLDPAVRAIAKRFGYSDEELFNPSKPGLASGERLRLGIARRYRAGRGKIKNRVLRPSPGSPMTSSRPTLAACSIAKNEERDLPGWLANTLRFCDEVVVVVDDSEDRTMDILRQAREEHGDRVRWVEHAMQPEEGFAGQRNVGIAAVTADWILHTDIDERATPELAAEIRLAIRDERLNGLRYRRLNHFLHHPVKGGGWAYWNKAWLARRGAHRFVNRLHEVTEIDGGDAAIGQMNGLMWHLCDEDFVERVEKNAKYMQGSGRQIIERGIHVRWYHMVLHPGWRAFKSFVLQGGWRDGTQGFLHAMYTFSSNFNWWAYAWDVQNRVEREELEAALEQRWEAAPPLAGAVRAEAPLASSIKDVAPSGAVASGGAS